MSRVIYRYSLNFKQKVVSEIEAGKYSVGEIKSIYGISGSETIPKWIKKLGKNHLLNKIVRIEMKGEKDRIKELEKEKKALTNALAKTQLKVICLESLVECVEDHYSIDVKKNFGGEGSVGAE